MKQQHHKNRNMLCVMRNLFLKRLITHHGLHITDFDGFTLVELMIAITIGMIIIGAVYSTYIYQQRSFTAQDQVAEMNTTSKIALDILANDIRETGFGIPDNLATIQRTAGCSGINGFTQKINLTDNTISEDQITLLGGFRRISEIAAPVNIGDTTLTLKDTSELKLGGNFVSEKGYISIAGLDFAIVTAIMGNTLTLQSSLSNPYPADVPVYLIENITYQVVNGELQRVRRLNGGGCGTIPDIDVIAENIEDLQFDGSATGRIRVNILAQTAMPDPNFQGQGNPPATVENRNHTAINDSLRRRWWQMEVDLRNPI